MAAGDHTRTRRGFCQGCRLPWPCDGVRLGEAAQHLKAADALGELVDDARTAFLHGSMADWGRTLLALFAGLDAYHEARGIPRQSDSVISATPATAVSDSALSPAETIS